MNENIVGNKVFMCKKRIAYSKKRNMRMLIAFNVITILPSISLLRK